MLLNIFRHYLDASPRLWPRLVHICRKWRHIVFTSQQALHLRLFCSFGTHVSKTLDCWPPLPIVLEYGGSPALDPPSPNDEVNIISALKRSDRISSISLTVTTSLLDKLYAVERPFWELEVLILLSRDSLPLALPKTFLCGPRIRRLHLTRIRMPELLQLLHFFRDLEDLQLHEALDPWCLSIEKLTDALSELAQLQSISLHFSSTTYHVPPPSPPDRRVVLPALTSLKFRGRAKYLERLILRMDAPRLGDIRVTLSDKFIYDLSWLGEFVDRIERHKSHHQARILFSDHTISISLTQPGAPACFKLQLLSGLFSEQLFAMSHILPSFSAFLLSVEDLHISVTQASSQEDSLHRERWLGLLESFTGVKWLHLDVNDSADIVRALQSMYSWRKTVPPALFTPHLRHPRPLHAPLSEAIVSFMTSRCHSGYPIGACRISDLHRTGTSLHSLYHYLLNCLKQDLFLSRRQLIIRCSAMSSF